MVETKEKPDTGSYRWEFDWCPKCRAKTAFWFLDEHQTKCAECETLKPRAVGLERDPRNFL